MVQKLEMGYCPLSMRLGARLGVAAGWARARLGVQAGAGARAWRAGRDSRLGCERTRRRQARRGARSAGGRRAGARGAQAAGAQGRAERRRQRARQAQAWARGALGVSERARGWASWHAAGRAGVRLGARCARGTTGRQHGRAACARRLGLLGQVGVLCTRLGFQPGFST